MSVISQIKRKMIEKNSSFISYIMVGAITAGVYITTFMILSKTLHGNYQLAVSISYVASVILHFSANRKFTFKNKTNVLSQQLPRYLILLLVNYIITIVVMYIAIEGFHLPPYLGIVLTIMATFMLGFLLSKFWIFQAV